MKLARSPKEPPTENTLTINIVHEILQWKLLFFEEAVALSPTRKEEKELGYDIALDWAKLYTLQFKQFNRNATGPIILKGTRTTGDFLKYEIRKEQHQKLCDNYPIRGMAFFVIPFAKRRDALPGLLPNTVFIDVHDIPVGTTKLSLPKHGLSIFSTPLRYRMRRVKGPVYYCKDREHHPLNKVYNWGEIWGNLLSCSQGFLLKEHGETSSLVEELSNELGRQEKDFSSRLQNVTEIVFGGNKLPEGVSWSANDFSWNKRVTKSQGGGL